ncbi:MAG: sulfatase-like hydrolase/transferase [Planctomycetaceae bacterium]
MSVGWRFLSAVLLLAVSGAPLWGADIRKPNVLMLVVDEWPRGLPTDEDRASDSIRKFMAGGVSFESAVANSPDLKAQQATLLTGLYPCHHGFFSGGAVAKKPAATLGTVLSGREFTCESLGAWRIPDGDSLIAGGDWGFEFPGCSDSASGAIESKDSLLVITDQASMRLQKYSDASMPFLLLINLQTPQADASQNLKDIGVCIDRLMEQLQSNGLRDSTIVILTALRNSEDETTVGAQRDVSACRIPTAIQWPGRIPAGRKSSACLSTVDLLPTVCGMVGVGFPDFIDGLDLSDSTRVDCSCEPDFAFLQRLSVDPTEQWRAVCDQRLMYLQMNAPPHAEFLLRWSLVSDRQRNLIADESRAADVRRMRQWLMEKRLVLQDD